MKEISLEEAQLLYDLGVEVQCSTAAVVEWGEVIPGERPGSLPDDHLYKWGVYEDETDHT